MDRSLSTMVVLQLAFGMIEYVGLGVVLRLEGYRRIAVPDSYWHPNAVFLRENLWVVFAIPVIWLALALLIDGTARLGFPRWAVVLSGALVVIIQFAVYVGAMFHPFHRPILILAP